MPLMNMRLARPKRIIDINPLTELDYVTVRADRLHIGAMTRHHTIERSAEVARFCPLLSRAVAFIGHPQVRNRGTIGGSLVHSDPAAEYPAVMAALDGEIVISGPRGEKIAHWRKFFVDYFTVDLAADEMVTEIRIPIPQTRTACEFLEVSRRQGDFAVAETAVYLELDGEDRCLRAAIALGGVASTPVRAEKAEALLRGARFSQERIREAGALACVEIDPTGDIHGSAQYRKQMVQVLVRRALESAWSRAAKT